MPDDDSKGIAQTFSGLNLLAGLWLIIAPWLLGYDTVPAALWNDSVVGIAVVILAGLRMLAPARHLGISRINAVLGLWLIVSPFVLQYGEGFVMRNVAFWNDVVLGSIVFVLARLSIATVKRAAWK